MTLSARRVRIKGTVQGVGFRPFIYELAREHGLSGHVLNDTLGVSCLVIGEDHAVDGFIDEIRPRAPRLAVVELVDVCREPIPDTVPAEFSIARSQSSTDRQAKVPMDTHACADCLREMRDPADRRFGYPLINCTNCGPRYSIIAELPYDRPMTSMRSFPMCAACRREYDDPADRRFHAQPIACHDCGPRLLAVDLGTGTELLGDDALRETARRLQLAEIVAIKGVGGFHLAVDAESSLAVASLRKRKRRDCKPFAVMARDLAAASSVADLSTAEKAMLASPQRPILLARKAAGAELLAEGVAPNNPSIGMMLPSAPYHELLFDHLDIDFVVMTSGNISGDPIETTNGGARSRLGALARYVLEHDRVIVNRLDDSVVRFTETGDAGSFVTYIRRGRGYAPYYLSSPLATEEHILGTGSELKSTSAITDGTTIFASQHVGDMTNTSTASAHRDATARLQSMYAVSPTAVLADKHPAFLERAEHLYGPAAAVQHHHAHMCSCMLDHGLPEGTYIGLVLDGVGFGDDASMWGAEFFVGGYREVARVSSLRTIPLLGGDAAVRQPRRIALALGLVASAFAELSPVRIGRLLGISQDEMRVFEVMLGRGINTIEVSSMGRLFDGVAALAGFAHESEYEAQGPIEFEGLLKRRLDWVDGYQPMERMEHESGARDPAGGVNRLDWAPLVRAVVADLLDGTDPAEVSSAFHSAVARSVADEVVRIASAFDVDQVVCSGGVFLNEFLSAHVPRLLADEGLMAYRNQRVPTNDAGISCGQVCVGQSRLLAVGDGS